MSDILDRGLLTAMLAGQHSSILNSIRLMQKPSVSAEEWEEELAKQQISKEDMNNLVMDFLVSEECKEAAESFQEEANVTISRSYLLDVRDQINKKISELDSQGIVDILDKMNDKILADNKELKAELLLLKLYAMIIHKEDVERVLAFASEGVTPELRNFASLDKTYELILGLLAFEDPQSSPSADKLLLWRDELQGRCKSALKKAQSISLESKLVKLLKLMRWMEARLGEKITFPRMRSLETAKLETNRDPLARD